MAARAFLCVAAFAATLAAATAQCNMANADVLTGGGCNLQFKEQAASDPLGNSVICFSVDISADTTWCAVAVAQASSPTMTNYEKMVVGTSSGTPKVVHKGTGDGNSQPTLVVDNGCIDNIAQSGNTITFSRKKDGSTCTVPNALTFGSTAVTLANPTSTWSNYATNSVNNHGGTALKSTSPVSLLNADSSGGQISGSVQGAEISDWKLHGTLMVIAWIGAASFGVYGARYTKDLLSWWIRLHQGAQIAAGVLTIAGVAYMFNATGNDWKTDSWDNSKHKGRHQKLGISVFSLVILQIVMGALRNVVSGAPSDPTDPKDHGPRRWVFNWIHRPLGYFIWVLAAATIWYGLDRFEAKKGAKVALYVWGALMAVVFLAIELSVVMGDADEPNKSLVWGGFAVVAVVSLGCLIAICAYISDGPQF